MRRIPVAVAAALAVILGASAPAAAEVRVEGRGFGHGIGLSQWGAYGYALEEARDFRWILGHYYTGTTVAEAPRARVRVLLRQARTMGVCSASRARGADRRVLRLSERRTYRLRPSSAGRVRLYDAATGRTRARLVPPVRITGGASTCLRGTALNGRRNGAYRGAMTVLADGNRLSAVNDASLEHYLYGVVPAEVPASWPEEALKAQSVAARSYALRAIKPAAPYDVLPTTASQVYGGVSAEAPATTAAVRATRALAVMAGEDVAATYFFSSSGGRTAAIEEVWTTSEPLAYLRSVEDPHDTLSPYHAWEVELSDAETLRRLGSPVEGERLEAIEVAETTPSGRAATVRVTTDEGEWDVPAGDVRTRLGLRSTWFGISRPAPGEEPPA